MASQAEPRDPDKQPVAKRAPRRLFDLLVTVAVVLAVCVLTYGLVKGVWPKPAAGGIPKEPISTGVAPSLGSRSARVVMAEFSDFECPYCGQFARNSLQSIEDTYIKPGLVRLVFINLPLSIHPRALRAAEAAQCAGMQGKFWPFHDLLFRNQTRLADDDLSQYANDLNLDAGLYKQCDLPEMDHTISQDVALAKSLNISATPTFVLGIAGGGPQIQVTAVLAGAQSDGQLEKVLKGLVAAAKTLPR